MARQPGYDKNTAKKILAILKKNPNGLWAREIARQTKLPKSTVHRYLSKYLKSRVKLVADVRGLVKLYRLR